MASRRRRHPAAYLLTIKQRKYKSLKAYMARFNKEHMTTDDQDDKITLAAHFDSLWP